MLDLKFKFVVCGQEGVGKTSLLLRYAKNRFLETKSTVGVEFLVKDVFLNNAKIRLHLWDFAGEGRFRTLLGPFCLGSSGAIFVYDMTDSISFDRLTEWMDLVNSNTAVFNPANERVPIPKVLVGTKKDLLSEDLPRLDPSIIATFMADHSIKSHFETSAKNGENVAAVFMDLVDQVMTLFQQKE
jgi:small GTP-binding protein